MLKKVDKTLFFLFATFFVGYFAIACYGPYANLYFKQQGISTATIGFLSSIMPVASILIQPLWARAADKTGKKHLILSIILLGSGITVLLFPLGKGVVFFAIILFCFAVFQTSMFSMQNAVTLQIAEKRGYHFSNIRIAGTLGYAVGILLLNNLITGNLALAFITCGISTFVTLIVHMVGVPKENTVPASSAGGGKEKKGGTLEVLKNKQVILLMLMLWCVYLSCSFQGAFIGLTIVDLGHSASYVGVCVFLCCISELPVLIFANRLIQKFGEMPLIIFSGILMTFRMMLISTGVLWVILVMMALQGIGYMLNFYCGSTLIHRLMPDHLKARGQSLIFLVQAGLGSVIGNMGGGLIAERIGFLNTFRLMGGVTFGVTLLVMVVSLLDRGKKKPIPRETVAVEEAVVEEQPISV